jgi:hypothetical protein
MGNQNHAFDRWFIPVFACAWSLFFMLYVSVVTFGVIPTANVRFADTILGFLLGTGASTILTYFFGSSASSKAKDDAIKDLAK